MKQLFDYSIAVTGIILLLPLILLVSIILLILDGRPIFFIQQRVGKNNKNFKIIKFRTMVNKIDYDTQSFDLGNDERVTKFGSFLRKFKIDEFPQLFNVLKGEMSIVGPRPEIRKWVNVYSERWDKVLTVNPGITDPASIIFFNESKILNDSQNAEYKYRNEILPRKLDLYEEYVNSQSILKDMLIILKTIKKIYL